MSEGERSARGVATTLQLFTGDPHRAREKTEVTLVSATSWWQVERRGWIFWKSINVRFCSETGERI